VQRGDIFGYLGPNGAGKTTTIRIMLGLMAANSGKVTLLGQDVQIDKTRQKIGFVLEADGLYDNLTAYDNLLFYAKLYDIPKPAQKVDKILKQVGLADRAKDKVSTYSKGMRQKILIAAALLHNPDIILLDEPLSGLDVNAAILVKDLLAALAAAGKTILYSSHVLEVVEKVAHNVLILRKGRVVAHDSVARLRELMSESSLEGVFTQLTNPEDTDAIANRMLEVVAA
jgi:ABC-2 type transport system ATP-binding protein